MPAPRRFHISWQVAVRLFVGLLVASLFSVAFARIVSDLANQTPLIRADLRISSLVQTFRTPAFTKAMVFATDLGRWQSIAVGTLALVAGLLLRRRKADVIALLLTLGFGEAAIWIIKQFIHRARPEPANALTFESSFSFPSGHTFVATLFYGLAFSILTRKSSRRVRLAGGFAGLAAVLAVGFSRVYLGVHWPSDVLASLSAGAAWLAIVLTVLWLVDGRKVSGKEEPPTRRQAIWIGAIAAAWACSIAVLYAEWPLRQPHAVPVVAQVIPEDAIAQKLFEDLPKTSEDIAGKPMEPINVVFVGSEQQVRDAFARSGWSSADPLSLHSARREIAAVAGRTPYPEQPGTPTFWNGRPNGMTYEKSTPARSIRERHHIHVWSSGVTSSTGAPIWVATAHFDKGFKRSGSTPIPVHAIEPEIDRQREYVREGFQAIGVLASDARFTVTGPLSGRNFAGDRFVTDGTAELLTLK